jgi:hypothetical protein
MTRSMRVMPCAATKAAARARKAAQVSPRSSGWISASASREWSSIAEWTWS